MFPKTLALCAAVALVAGAAADPMIDQTLQRVRDAVGYERIASLASGIQLTGKGRFLGNDVELSGVIGNRGEYVRRFAGAIPYDIGWDGQVAWRSEFSGWSRVLAAGERNEQRIDAAIQTSSSLAKDSPLRFTDARRDDPNGRFTLNSHFLAASKPVASRISKPPPCPFP